MLFMIKSDIPFLSATDLGILIKSKELSPVEAVTAYLDRIQEINPKLNAYITVCRDRALDQAKQAEQEINNGNYLGPLHGVPVAVKDQIHSAGIVTTDASKIRSDFVPQENATVLENLNNSGAILLGKLNLSEFALGDPISSAYGPARNPWDLERNPGTSSTGSGAATAGFLCATSLGEDTGGSIRGPAANCGLVGLRPTWGRVSRYGVDGACWSIDTIGPISRTVSDCAITIGSIAGHDPKDRYTSNIPIPDFVNLLNGNLKGLKIGLVMDFLDSDELGVTSATKEAVVAAAEHFRTLGAEVLEISMPLAKYTGTVIRTITHTDRVSLFPDRIRTRASDHHHNTKIAFMAANLIPAQVYYKAQKLREMVRTEVMEAFKSVDVLIQPTSSGPAGKINLEPGVRNIEQAKKDLIEGSYRGIYSLAGVPALSICCGFTDIDGKTLPLALQIAGRPFDEATVLNTAYAYEQSNSWKDIRPEF
ncbi:MAG: Asp-tRNA(Asn)/Glu-tRNA(Gln) amidotransferase GatCAB subunit A [Dehalococcoidia bacterium]|nr:Asp-tRNA(Asn)/Glu-tRNA(Gln) amidotransferase GatCAB subunit A [Dehalococcoidia bacterium]